MFDFIYVRFVLEYFRKNSFEIVKNISNNLIPGGIICLIDLDCNCLRHFGLSPRLERTLWSVMENLENSLNFDPYAGLKLFSYLYDMGFEDIDVRVASHNLIFNELIEKDKYNWTRKVKIACEKSDVDFVDYEGGFKEFFQEFTDYFEDRRRFTYTPLISCRGQRPV